MNCTNNMLWIHNYYFKWMSRFNNLQAHTRNVNELRAHNLDLIGLKIIKFPLYKRMCEKKRGRECGKNVCLCEHGGWRERKVGHKKVIYLKYCFYPLI